LDERRIARENQMVARYVIDDDHRRRVEQALALIDVGKVRWRKKRLAHAHATSARRFKERHRAKPPRPDFGVKSLPNELRKRLPLPGWQVLAARMQPGVWYRFTDLVAIMPEYARGSVKAWLHQRLPREGVAIDRAGNPDFDPAAPAQTANQGGRYLFKIGDKAVSVAQGWALAIGEVSERPGHNEKARQ